MRARNTTSVVVHTTSIRSTGQRGFFSPPSLACVRVHVYGVGEPGRPSLTPLGLLCKYIPLEYGLAGRKGSSSHAIVLHITWYTRHYEVYPVLIPKRPGGARPGRVTHPGRVLSVARLHSSPPRVVASSQALSLPAPFSPRLPAQQAGRVTGEPWAGRRRRTTGGVESL